jgi:hypothetical protein
LPAPAFPKAVQAVNFMARRKRLPQASGIKDQGKRPKWGGKRTGAGRKRELALSVRRDVASEYLKLMRKTRDDLEGAPRRDAVIRLLTIKYRATHRMIVRCLNEFLADTKWNTEIFSYAVDGLNEIKPLPARETDIKRLEPGVYTDGKLRLLVISPGKRRWIFRFIWRSMIRDMELGESEMSLAAARARAKEASRMKARGQNPIDGSWINVVLEGVSSKS